MDELNIISAGQPANTCIISDEGTLCEAVAGLLSVAGVISDGEMKGTDDIDQRDDDGDEDDLGRRFSHQ